jgi:hypothetical protein
MACKTSIEILITAEAQRTQRQRREKRRIRRRREEERPLSSSLCVASAFSAPLR